MPKRSKDTKRTLNPQALRRLELVSLLTKTGAVTLSNATVGNWLAAGMPRNPNGTLSLVQVCAWLAAERRKKPVPPAASAIEDLRKRQTEVVEFELKRRRGEYFERAEVVAQFEEAAARMKAVLEAVERNHGPSVGATIRDALKKSFGKIEEMVSHADRPH